MAASKKEEIIQIELTNQAKSEYNQMPSDIQEYFMWCRDAYLETQDSISEIQKSDEKVAQLLKEQNLPKLQETGYESTVTAAENFALQMTKGLMDFKKNLLKEVEQLIQSANNQNAPIS